MPGFKLTEGYIDLTIDNSKITSALGVVGKALQKVHDTIIRTTKSMVKLSIVLGTLSLKAFANFETAMRKATSVSEANEQQFKKMSDMAIEQSERLNIAATDAADAFWFLGSAGLSVSEQMKAYVPVALLAKASTIAMSDAAEILLGTMKGFSIPFEETGRVADVLAKGVNKSFLSMENLGQSMAMISGVADITNNSLEDTVTMLAAMADLNIKGTRAATAMRRALLNMAAPMSSVRDMLDKWNVAVYDSTGKMRPFIQIFGDLAESLKNADEAERNMAFTILFGMRAIAGQLAMLKKGKKGLEDFSAALNEEGYAQKIADRQMKAFGEQIGIVWQKIKNLTRLIGEALAPGMLRLAKSFGKVIDLIKELATKHMLTIQKWGELTAATIIFVRKTLFDIVKFMITDWPAAWEFAFGTIKTLAIALKDTVAESFKQMWAKVILETKIAISKIIETLEKARAKMMFGEERREVFTKLAVARGQASRGAARLEYRQGQEEFVEIASFFKNAAKTIADSVPPKIAEEFRLNLNALRWTIEQIEDKYQRLKLNELVDIAEKQVGTAGTGGGGAGATAAGGGFKGAGGFSDLAEGWKRLASATSGGGGVQQKILGETTKARHERLKQDPLDAAAQRKEEARIKRQGNFYDTVEDALRDTPLANIGFA